MSYHLQKGMDVLIFGNEWREAGFEVFEVPEPLEGTVNVSLYGLEGLQYLEACSPQVLIYS